MPHAHPLCPDSSTDSLCEFPRVPVREGLGRWWKRNGRHEKESNRNSGAEEFNKMKWKMQ